MGSGLPYQSQQLATRCSSSTPRPVTSHSALSSRLTYANTNYPKAHTPTTDHTKTSLEPYCAIRLNGALLQSYCHFGLGVSLIGSVGVKCALNPSQQMSLTLIRRRAYTTSHPQTKLWSHAAACLSLLRGLCLPYTLSSEIETRTNWLSFGSIASLVGSSSTLRGAGWTYSACHCDSRWCGSCRPLVAVRSQFYSCTRLKPVSFHSEWLGAHHLGTTPPLK